jgi:hypothetical protein
MESADILYDCGGVCDPSTGRFDHHSNAILPLPPDNRVCGYATAGLVWRQWGRDIVADYITHCVGDSWSAYRNLQDTELQAQMVDGIVARMDFEFVAPIDAWDRGIRPERKHFGALIPMQWLLSQLEFEAAVEALGSVFLFRLQALVNGAGDAWRLQGDLVGNGPTEFYENSRGVLVEAHGNQKIDVFSARQAVHSLLGLSCMGVISPLRQGTRWALFLTDPLPAATEIPPGVEYLANRRCFYHGNKSVLHRLAMQCDARDGA